MIRQIDKTKLQMQKSLNLGIIIWIFIVLLQFFMFQNFHNTTLKYLQKIRKTYTFIYGSGIGILKSHLRVQFCSIYYNEEWGQFTMTQ